MTLSDIHGEWNKHQEIVTNIEIFWTHLTHSFLTLSDRSFKRSLEEVVADFNSNKNPLEVLTEWKIEEGEKLSGK